MCDTEWPYQLEVRRLTQVSNICDTKWLYWSEMWRLTQQVSNIYVIPSGFIGLRCGDSHNRCPTYVWYQVALLVWGVETHPGVQHICDTKWLYWSEVWRLTQVSSICVREKRWGNVNNWLLRRCWMDCRNGVVSEKEKKHGCFTVGHCEVWFPLISPYWPLVCVGTKWPQTGYWSPLTLTGSVSTDTGQGGLTQRERVGGLG